MKMNQFGTDRRADTHRDDHKDRPWRKDAAPISKAPSNPDYPTMPFDKDEWMKSATREDQSDIPTVGDTIRTKGGTEGKVVKIVGDEIYYTIADGRMMKSPLHRVVPVEKLEDGDEELCEISNEVLARYKSAAGKDASAADARGDFKKGDKRFSGIVKATKKQFDNDAKSRQTKESGSGGVSGAFAVENGMTGINRSAPAQDVSYERMLDDDVINELKVDTMRNFNNKVSSTDRFRTASGLQLVKDKEGKERALRKIAAKTGDRTRDSEKVKRGTYEERLAEFLDLDEEYRGPHLGDAEKLAKAPKSTMQGSDNVRFSQLVQDSIKEHGLKWAFEYYVKKHGLPPRQFQIYAGLAAKPKAVAPAKSEWTDPSRTKRSPAKKSLLQRLRGMLPFEE